MRKGQKHTLSDEICNVRGCSRPHFANGRCLTCEWSWRYCLEPEFRERHDERARAWKEQIMVEELAELAA